MFKIVSQTVLLTLFLLIPVPLPAQTEPVLTQEKLFEHWKKSKEETNSVLKDGLFFEAFLHQVNSTTKVHIGEKYLHCESKHGVFVYSQDKIFGLRKTLTGYSLIQSFPYYSGPDQEEQKKLTNQILRLQDAFLGEPMYVRAFEFPDFFRYLPSFFHPNWAWLETSRFVKMDPVFKNQKGLYELHYIEDNVAALGGQGTYRTTKLIIDPNQNSQVVSQEYGDKFPSPKGGFEPVEAKGFSKFQFVSLPQLQNRWVLKEYQMQEMEGLEVTGSARVSFSNFKPLKINPDLLKLSYYGITDETETLQTEFPEETSSAESDPASFPPLIASITVIGLLFLLGQKARPRKMAQSC